MVSQPIRGIYVQSNRVSFAAYCLTAPVPVRSNLACGSSERIGNNCRALQDRMESCRAPDRWEALVQTEYPARQQGWCLWKMSAVPAHSAEKPAAPLLRIL